MIDRYAAKGDWHLAGLEWPAALRIVPQDRFLLAHSPAWVAAQTLDYFVPKGKRVWSSAPVAEAYCSTDIMIGFQSAEGELIQDILTTGVFDNQAPTQIDRFTFPKRLVEHLRIAQTATNVDLWSIGEVHLYNGDTEIPRTASWRLNATPFPWDIELAFDGNPVTRWKSWESIHPGMHVDVDFGKIIEMDRIELHSSHDEANIQIHPEVCDAVNCGAFPATLNRVNVQPIGDLRRLAAKTVKARGVDYLLIDDPYRIAADIKGDPARWGLEFIVDRGPFRLYRIL